MKSLLIAYVPSHDVSDFNHMHAQLFIAINW